MTANDMGAIVFGAIVTCLVVSALWILGKTAFRALCLAYENPRLLFLGFIGTWAVLAFGVLLFGGGREAQGWAVVIAGVIVFFVFFFIADET